VLEGIQRQKNKIRYTDLLNPIVRRAEEERSLLSHFTYLENGILL